MIWNFFLPKTAFKPFVTLRLSILPGKDLSVSSEIDHCHIYSIFLRIFIDEQISASSFGNLPSVPVLIKTMFEL